MQSSCAKGPVVYLVLAALLTVLPSWLAAEPSESVPGWPNTDFSRKSIDLSEVRSGGPPKDGIPSIDSPKFVSLEKAAEWLHAREPVIALTIAGQARAYPLQILMWHEIVNDTLAGVPVVVTFCPLCNASIVFDRRVNKVVLDFGTTGRLRKSDMVMYDRQTESWWQQFTGEGIVGDMTGVVLRQVDSQIIAFEDFARAFPKGEVLSRETGHVRNYGANPYAGYDNINSFPFLFSGEQDDRLPPMERVLAVRQGERYTLFPFELLKKEPIIHYGKWVIFAHNTVRSALDQTLIAASRDIPVAAAFEPTVKGQSLHFEWRNGKVVDGETGSYWNALGQAVSGPLKGAQLKKVDAGVHFAFAWLAFDAGAEVYKARQNRD